MVACPDLAGLGTEARMLAWHGKAQYSPHENPGPEPKIRKKQAHHLPCSPGSCHL